MTGLDFYFLYGYLANCPFHWFAISTAMVTTTCEFHGEEVMMCNCFLPSFAKDSHVLCVICKS